MDTIYYNKTKIKKNNTLLLRILILKTMLSSSVLTIYSIIGYLLIWIHSIKWFDTYSYRYICFETILLWVFLFDTSTNTKYPILPFGTLSLVIQYWTKIQWQKYTTRTLSVIKNQLTKVFHNELRRLITTSNTVSSVIHRFLQYMFDNTIVLDSWRNSKRFMEYLCKNPNW